MKNEDRKSIEKTPVEIMNSANLIELHLRGNWIHIESKVSG